MKKKELREKFRNIFNEIDQIIDKAPDDLHISFVMMSAFRIPGHAGNGYVDIGFQKGNSAGVIKAVEELRVAALERIRTAVAQSPEMPEMNSELAKLLTIALEFHYRKPLRDLTDKEIEEFLNKYAPENMKVHVINAEGKTMEQIKQKITSKIAAVNAINNTRREDTLDSPEIY